MGQVRTLAVDIKMPARILSASILAWPFLGARMIRILFTAVAVVAAGLALVLDRTELYGVAAGLLAIVLVMWAAVSRRRFTESKKPVRRKRKSVSAQSEPELEALGILDIRPKTLEPESAGEKAELQGAAGARLPDAAFESGVRSADQAAGTQEIREFVVRRTGEEAKAPPPLAPPNEDVLANFMETVRLAVAAHAVCLLHQSKDTNDCTVVAIAGENRALQVGKSYRSVAPLVTPPYGWKPVTVRQVGSDDLSPRCLGYSATPGSLREVAIAPVNSRGYVLVADTTQEDGLSHPQVHAMLEQFTQTLGILLVDGDPIKPRPRPRREIIQEEMTQARVREQELALAIVVLNRADYVASLGEAVVLEAEDRLRMLLREVSSASRVVRFGELLFGVFLGGAMEELEAWDQSVHTALSAEKGLLEGGVSVGIARLTDKHESPNDFREDAVTALRAAYKSGKYTIVT